MKKKIYTRALLIFVFAIVGASVSAMAGIKEGGGGDLCEDRFQEVRNDLRDWILAGGPTGLVLPQGVTLAQYTPSMLTAIHEAKVECAKFGDPDFPILIGQSAKICAFSKSGSDERIVCDFDKFQSLSQSDQYVLVHHEYAGLSGLEMPSGEISDYSLSNQLSGYLTTVEMKRLSVKKPVPQAPNDLRKNLSNFAGSYRIVSCKIDRQIGFENPAKHDDCSQFKTARFFFYRFSESPSWNEDLVVDLINPKSIVKGGSIVAYGNNEASDTCTTFLGNQFCTGENEYGHWASYLSMSVEGGFTRVIYGGGIIDKGRYYHYDVTTLVLKKMRN